MIQETGIWRRSFGAYETNHLNITKLTASLENFRNNVAHLTSRIAAGLPHLTIHDIMHLDALWEVADKIVGDEFPLNPLEAYVFGGAQFYCMMLPFALMHILRDSKVCVTPWNGEMLTPDSLVWPTIRRTSATRLISKH